MRANIPRIQLFLSAVILVSLVCVLQESLLIPDRSSSRSEALARCKDCKHDRKEEDSTSFTKIQASIKTDYSSFHGYASKDEFQSRSSRFPSVDERMRLYMADWYTPPCANNTDGFIHYTTISQDDNERRFLMKEIEGRETKRPLFLINSTDGIKKSIWHVERSNLNSMKKTHNAYKNSFNKYLFPAFEEIVRNNNETVVPTLVQVGDSNRWRAYVPSTGEMAMFPNIPFLRKFRLALNKTDIAGLQREECHSGQRPVLGKYKEDFQPIIWLLRVKRYYGMLPEIAKEDTPWAEKKNMAVFRGVGTGANIPRWNNFELPSKMTALDECLLVKVRCRLPYLYQNSSLVDAKVVASSDAIWDRLYGPLQREGINLEGSPMQRVDMLKYKAIIILEGNDVSSGLKWALMSQSVVMMQPPTCTSWAMEELLVPWIHYIPLNQNLTDVEEKMQWVIDNGEEAERVAHRGSLWMKDLFFHRDSERDNQMILYEMARRYSNYFVSSSELASTSK